MSKEILINKLRIFAMLQRIEEIREEKVDGVLYFGDRAITISNPYEELVKIRSWEDFKDGRENRRNKRKQARKKKGKKTHYKTKK